MVNFVAENVVFADVNLRNLGIARIKSDGAEKREVYPLDCLCFVANGSGSASVGGKTERGLSRGAVLYVKRGEEIVFIPTENDELEVYGVTIDAYDNGRFFNAIGFSDEKRQFMLDGKMNVVEELYKTAKRGTAASAYESAGKFYELLSCFAQANESEAKPKTDENEYVAKAKEYIHMQYHLDINVTAIADAVYLNRSYFSTMFKRETGVSPLEYLLDFRIGQACKLLAMGKGVTDTAMLTGFGSASAFAAHFKRKMKETPSEYKARVTYGGKNEEDK